MIVRHIFFALLMVWLVGAGIPKVAAMSFEISPTIVGGESASIAYYPWQVYLEVSHEQSVLACGGTLVGEYWVLTAAHCVWFAQPKQLYIHVGMDDIQSVQNLNQTSASYRSVKAIYVHPNYDGVVQNDIAILELNKSAITLRSQPIPLIASTELPIFYGELSNQVADNLATSGWGNIDSLAQQRTSILQRTLLTGIDDEQCPYLQYNDSQKPFVICAVSTDDTGICNGDSGGPLVWQDPRHAADEDKGYRLVGITSFYTENKENSGCANAIPDGFTEIAGHLDFITMHIPADAFEFTSSFSGDIFTPIDGPDSVPEVEQESGGSSLNLFGVLALMLLLLFRRYRHWLITLRGTLQR